MTARLSLEQMLHRLGGVATRATLIELTSRLEVDHALRDRRVVRISRGRYALPMADQARRAASVLRGVASHRSAAAYWGWAMKTLPKAATVTVARNRSILATRRSEHDVSWSQIDPVDIVEGWVTSPTRTFVDCCRDLPFDEALAIADSALRSNLLTRPHLLQAADRMRGPGRPRALRVARESTSRAVNPFESVLRAIALDTPGLSVRPQELLVEQPFSVRPDLCDRALRLAIEADSFAWHGNRKALMNDCRRYNLLAANGWWVLRYSWEDVMGDPDYVAESLRAMVSGVRPA